MKSAKNLLVPFIVLIMLVIGLIVYSAVERFRNTEPSETSDGVYDVLYYNPGDISSISVYNRETGHSSVVKCLLDSDNNIQYEYLGDDAEPGVYYAQYKLSDYVSSLTSFYSSTIVSKTGNFSEYGLDNPSYTLTISLVNGTVTNVYLGNKTPDTKYCYMFVEGAQDIYLVSSDKLVQADKTAISFLDPTVLRIDSKNLKAVHFDRKSDGLSLDAAVALSASGITSYEIVKPYHHPASAYFANMVDNLLNLEISEYIEINDLSKYGLDDPAFHFVLALTNGEKTEIYFSDLINEYYYGYIAGYDKYFKLNKYQLENLDMMETVLIDSYICYCFAKDISSINVTYGDKSFKFDLNVAEGRSITDDRSTVTLDGRNAKVSDSSGRSYCSILFESIACIKIGGIDTEATVDTSKGPVITISFIGKNYATTDFEFYTRDADSYYVLKNGEYMGFYVYSGEIFNDGAYDTYNYGFWKAYELLSEAISGSVNGIYDIPAA
ncbi:MAG: DUF4340 domain-containing protein [Clostridiales bacterium]|nr:DUF4340 domain-containing protein [Clostridiales bacterium]